MTLKHAQDFSGRYPKTCRKELTEIVACAKMRVTLILEKCPQLWCGRAECPFIGRFPPIDMLVEIHIFRKNWPEEIYQVATCRMKSFRVFESLTKLTEEGRDRRCPNHA